MGGRGGAAGARWDEVIADGREHADEPLQVPGRSKALHRPLSSAERQMRIFRSVVKPLVRAVFDVWHDLASGSRVGAELVGDHAPGRAALLAQEPFQQALGGLGVAAALDDLIKDVSVLVNSPPQPVLLARDVTTTSSKCQMSRWLGVLRLRRRAYAVPNFSAHRRTVS